MIDNTAVKKVLSEASRIQDIVNNHYLQIFADLHNIKKEYNKFEVKQEVIAYRAYFPGVKKKYVLRIINKEGIDCDEYDIKGLLLNRSDYPKFTKAKLAKLIDLLMMSDEISILDIRKFINDTLAELNQLIVKRDKSIGRPVSFSKKIELYKKFPTHIISMFAWNEIEYNYFVHGTKGHSYKIHGVDSTKIDLNKYKIYSTKYSNLEYIVVPADDELPDYYIIDRDHIIKTVWSKPCSDFINAFFKIGE